MIDAVLYAVYRFTLERTKKVGISYEIELMLITDESIIPRPIPISDDVVNYDTDLPEISPMLFRLANLTLIDARDAAARRKQMFLPTFAVEASARKYVGNTKVMISM